MKKVLRIAFPLLLALVLGAGMAVAGDLALSLSQVASPTCEAPSPALEPAVVDAIQAPAEVDLFTPEPQPAAICPLIGCLNGHCRRDRDCTAAPGGVCNLFCPTQGCCAYPAQ